MTKDEERAYAAIIAGIDCARTNLPIEGYVKVLSAIQKCIEGSLVRAAVKKRLES